MDQIWAVKAVWTQISIDYSNLQTLPISILITYFHINYSNLLLLRKSTSHLHQPTIQSPRNLQQLTWLTMDRRRLPACTERFVTCAKECVSAALRLILSALRFSLSRCIWPPGLMLFTMCPCAGSWDFHFCWKSSRKLSLVLLATSISKAAKCEDMDRSTACCCGGACCCLVPAEEGPAEEVANLTLDLNH